MHTFAQKPKTTQRTTPAKSTIRGRGHLWQSPELISILHLQGTIGNQAVQRMLQPDAQEPEAGLIGPALRRFGYDFSRIPIHSTPAGVIQAKLAINKPGDEYEQEADRVAEQVMRMPGPKLRRVCPCGGGCPKCQTNQPSQEQERLHTKRVNASNTGRIAAPPSVHQVLLSPGQPLDPATRASMETRFGYDFCGVRVHLGGSAEKSVEDVNAHAYTVGQHIVFGEGQFALGNRKGRRLLAHELTHVVQQSQADRTSAVTLRVQRAPGRPGASAPSPPDWLGSWKSSAVHVKGDIWDIKPPSLGGDTWVGPYDQLSAYIKEQGFAGKMEAAHIVGGEHLQDIGSAFSYEKGPCVAVDKPLHATWTKQTANLQSQKGPMGGRATKEWSRPRVTTEDVTGLYDELYRSHPELKEMSRNIVKGQGAPQPVRVTSSGTRPAPETKPATRAKTGAPIEPGSETTSGIKPRLSAGTGSAATSAGVSKGRVRAGVEFEEASGKTAIKLHNINIADYPPDKRGPVTRFFKDRPVLAQLSAAAASMALQYLKGKAFDQIQEHFDSAIHNAREEFELTFPDTRSLLAEGEVTQTRRVYQTALAALRAPNVKRDLLLILAAFSPPEQIEEAVRTAKRLGATHKIRGNDIQNFLMASDAYVEAIGSVQNTLYEYLEYRPVLPAIAKEIFARAAVLTSLGTDLEDLFWKMAPLAVFPSAAETVLDIYWAAGIFANLGDRLQQFGAEVEHRHWEYRRLINSLDREFGEVNREVLRWNQ